MRPISKSNQSPPPIIEISNKKIFEYLREWLDEMKGTLFYCLEEFKLNDGDQWGWVLRRCNESDIYVYVLVNKGDARDLIELNSLTNNTVYNIILCYNTNLSYNEKFICWMKEDQPLKIEETIVNINKKEGFLNVIYLYYYGDEYLLLYNSNGIIKKFSNCIGEEYKAIKDIVNSNGDRAISYILEGYDKAKDEKLSIIDVALNDLKINEGQYECDFYKKLLPFMIAGEFRDQKYYEVYNVHTINNVYISKDLDTEKSKQELGKILNTCKRKGFL